jgi:6-phosphogluconolactonase
VSAVPEIIVVPGAAALFRAAAAAFVREAACAIQARGSFAVALSGGSTPKSMYELLANDSTFRDQVDWTRVHVFWGDERHVPPNHPDSNYGMAQDALLSRVPIGPDHVHRVPSENPDADDAAAEYEETLRAFFRLGPGQFPCFDCALLGLGADAHTASLFPGNDALSERTRLVVSTWVPSLSAQRITLSVPVFNHAACVIFLVSGGDKAEALNAMLEAPNDPRRWPAQTIRPESGRLVVIVDAPAARLLRASTRLS